LRTPKRCDTCEKLQRKIDVVFFRLLLSLRQYLIDDFSAFAADVGINRFKIPSSGNRALRMGLARHRVFPPIVRLIIGRRAGPGYKVASVPFQTKSPHLIAVGQGRDRSNYQPARICCCIVPRPRESVLPFGAHVMIPCTSDQRRADAKPMNRFVP